MSLLVIGCGKMGGALVARWASEIEIPITVAVRSSNVVPQGTALVRSPSELEGMLFDQVVIAVKPQVIGEVVPDYLPYISKGACMLSIAAGISIESLTSIVGDRPIIRMMPNLPGEIGRGVTGYFANEKCSVRDIAFAKVLTESVGMSLQVSQEEDLDKVTAVAGSGTGYAFEIIRCWIEAAEAIGLSPSVSKELVLETIGGAVDLASMKPDSIEVLRNSVASPNGTTAAGLERLRENDSIEKLMKVTVNAALARAIELR
ncbi:MAG: pyrroline-5-carboxylate reductase [bacterium]|jgi:pyrroline-5-carboxylate reductase